MDKNRGKVLLNTAWIVSVYKSDMNDSGQSVLVIDVFTGEGKYDVYMPFEGLDQIKELIAKATEVA